jgi:hypothetical protein
VWLVTLLRAHVCTYLAVVVTARAPTFEPVVFDPLPRVAQVFEEFDVNGSGYLDFDEFSRMLPALGIHLPPSKVVRWLPCSIGMPLSAVYTCCSSALGSA